jgi:hypothetical protein
MAYGLSADEYAGGLPWWTRHWLDPEPHHHRLSVQQTTSLLHHRQHLQRTHRSINLPIKKFKRVGHGFRNFNKYRLLCRAKLDARAYTQWGEHSDCVTEVRERDAIRIAWVTVVAGVVTVLPGARECSLELRGDQVDVFEATLTAAMQVCHTDIAIHGRHWADDEAEVMSPPGMTEAEFVDMIYEMAVADAPTRFAIIGEIGDRVDAIKLAWGMKLSDHHTEVVSVGSDHVRASFSSASMACGVGDDQWVGRIGQDACRDLLAGVSAANDRPTAP